MPSVVPQQRQKINKKYKKGRGKGRRRDAQRPEDSLTSGPRNPPADFGRPWQRAGLEHFFFLLLFFSRGKTPLGNFLFWERAAGTGEHQVGGKRGGSARCCFYFFNLFFFNFPKDEFEWRASCEPSVSAPHPGFNLRGGEIKKEGNVGKIGR